MCMQVSHSQSSYKRPSPDQEMGGEETGESESMRKPLEVSASPLVGFLVGIYEQMDLGAAFCSQS